jgi:hypothetical protein
MPQSSLLGLKTGQEASAELSFAILTPNRPRLEWLMNYSG